jgi:hypothetical protein
MGFGRVSALAVLQRATAQSITLIVANGRIKGRGPKPDPAFLAELREHEAEIIVLLTEGAHAAPREPITSARDTIAVGEPEPGTPKRDLVRESIEALKHTRQNQVWFHLEGNDVRIEHSPQMPAHLLGRLRKASKGIAAILLCPIRPAGYSNEVWLEAVLDADRLGYPC